jgi:hypothetical protein
MIFTLALRSLLVHPVRSLVLACGFGLGVSVMATLLGVGEVILEQARSPALAGGGDLLVTGASGNLPYARFLQSSVLGAPPFESRVLAASPTRRARLYLVRAGRTVPVVARGGVPSLERALADPETANQSAWNDSPADAAWSKPDPADVLRVLDRFHPIPDVPARAGSWAEWLYFNGRNGATRFYLTFFVGPRSGPGRRAAGVRLQLDTGGAQRSYSASATLDEAELLARAPDLAIGKSRVALAGLRYEISVDAPGERGGRASGTIGLTALPGRSVPPIVLRGAAGWLSGYVVPVLSGALDGELVVDGTTIPLAGGSGYHDHNWGFWKGVSWRWGQVHHDDLSIVYGRVHPPADAADAERIPGLLAVLGPQGPLAFSNQLSIEEDDDPKSGSPKRIELRGKGGALDLRMQLGVEDAIATRMPQGFFGEGMDFLQLRARYRVTGRVGERALDFEAPGSAETFRAR